MKLRQPLRRARPALDEARLGYLVDTALADLAALASFVVPDYLPAEHFEAWLNESIVRPAIYPGPRLLRADHALECSPLTFKRPRSRKVRNA